MENFKVNLVWYCKSYNFFRFLLRIDSEGSVINVEEGRPWENSGMEYHKIKAFRLEPYGDALGNLAIDGEVNVIII